MDEFMKAVEAATAWINQHGGTVTGLSRQMDGRWFLLVVTDEKNWDAARNMFINREADLGLMDDDLRRTAKC